ncbi:RICIN domain-containing protein [Archangium violaceum]|nr:RICIN domain-containing protein [Archangium violaceum]
MTRNPSAHGVWHQYLPIHIMEDSSGKALDVGGCSTVDGADVIQ